MPTKTSIISLIGLAVITISTFTLSGVCTYGYQGKDYLVEFGALK
jgi:hypothetical protein